ncbi:hypothetical protein DQW77_00625 [Roseovarius sp. TE539]|uniref:hypothetical protein n=1 Tax=Roseovarius sp. TE539 TaxID=2249812 RepID=UPI000DE10A46|nr:hypothetical protein [Roseovarius sp. TE539]RBI77539.1 hypothetical protein DQW77_00625 [Roseovarius sp. TE539]
MDTDLALVIGLVIAVFSVPAALSALSDGRAPRVAAFAMIAGGALVVWALTQSPGGYRIADIPDVFVRVVASFLR